MVRMGGELRCGEPRLQSLADTATVRRILIQAGAFGQGLSLGNVTFLTVLAILLAACSGSNDARFAGPITTVQGACSPGFAADGTATATLTLRGGNVVFAPSGGVIVLGGRIDGAGHVLAQSNAPGADKKPFPQVFEGELQADHVRGTFATPRCRATVDLIRF